MVKEHLRSLVLEVLRNNSWKNQFAELHNAVKSLAQQREITFERQEIELAANEVIWDLLTDGVLAPTGDDKHFDFRFLEITDYGRQRIANGSLPANDDPERYLDRLSEQIGRPLDGIIRIYAGEALSTFLTGSYFPSMVMLGVAAGQCIALLVRAYTTTPEGKPRKPTFAGKIRKTRPGSREHLEAVRGEFVKAAFPPDMAESLELQLSGLFTLIRYSRDTEGEPIGRTVDRDTAHASLLLFPQYCKWVYDLIDYLEKAEV